MALTASSRGARTMSTRFTATWELVQKGKVDNIFDDQVLFNTLKDKGNLETVECVGDSFTKPIGLGKNTTVKSFTMYDTFNTNSDEINTTAFYDYKNMGGTVIASWQEEMENAGEAKVLDQISDKIENLESSIEDTIQTQLWAVQPGNGGKDLDGVPYIVALAPTTGSYASISRASNSTWRNTYKSCGAYGTYMELYMENTYNNTTFKNQPADLAIASLGGYEFWHKLMEAKQDLQAYHNYTSQRLVSLGFPGIGYKQAFMTWDRGLATNSPTTGDSVYFLNSKYLKLRQDPRANFSLGNWIESSNQAAKIAKMLWRGSLYCTSLRHQGLLYGITA